MFSNFTDCDKCVSRICYNMNKGEVLQKSKNWCPRLSRIRCGRYENSLILTFDKHELTHPACIHRRRERYLVKFNGAKKIIRSFLKSKWPKLSRLNENYYCFSGRDSLKSIFHLLDARRWQLVWQASVTPLRGEDTWREKKKRKQTLWLFSA